MAECVTEVEDQLDTRIQRHREIGCKWSPTLLIQKTSYCLKCKHKHQRVLLLNAVHLKLGSAVSFNFIHAV